MMTRAAAGGLLCLLLGAAMGLELPDTSGIDGQLTANLGVDHFFSLWLVFSNDEVKMSGKGKLLVSLGSLVEQFLQFAVTILFVLSIFLELSNF